MGDLPWVYHFSWLNINCIDSLNKSLTNLIIFFFLKFEIHKKKYIILRNTNEDKIK